MKNLFIAIFSKCDDLTEGQIEEKANSVVQELNDNSPFRFESEAKTLGANIVVEILLE